MGFKEKVANAKPTDWGFRHMTVRELIGLLEEVNGDLPVIVYEDYEDAEHPLPLGDKTVSVEEIQPFKYGGKHVAVIHV